jgi:hypothetical protein
MTIFPLRKDKRNIELAIKKLEGAKYRELSSSLGISHSRVHQIVQGELRRVQSAVFKALGGWEGVTTEMLEEEQLKQLKGKLLRRHGST